MFSLLPLPPSPSLSFLSFFLFATDLLQIYQQQQQQKRFWSFWQWGSSFFLSSHHGSGKIQTTFPSSCSSFLTKLLLLLLLFVAQLLHPDESLMYNRHGFLASSSSSFLSQDLKWVSLLLDHCGQGWYCTCLCLASQLLDDSFLLFVRCCCLFDLTYYHFGSGNFLSLIG